MARDYWMIEEAMLIKAAHNWKLIIIGYLFNLIESHWT